MEWLLKEEKKLKEFQGKFKEKIPLKGKFYEKRGGLLGYPSRCIFQISEKDFPELLVVMQELRDYLEIFKSEGIDGNIGRTKDYLRGLVCHLFYQEYSLYWRKLTRLLKDLEGGKIRLNKAGYKKNFCWHVLVCEEALKELLSYIEVIKERMV